MTITRKDVEEAIFYLADCVSNNPQVLNTALTILKSVLENGLSLSQKEIEEIIRKEWDSICPLPHSFAHALHEAQMKGVEG